MIPVPDISQTYPKTSLTLDSRFVVGEGNARDLSGDSNTGTLVSGRAVLFDGAADYIDCGAGVDATASGSSLVAWVKPGTVGSGGLTSILESCVVNGRFAIGLSESESKFYVTRLFSGGYDGHTSTAVSAGTWYHVVGTVSADGNTIALYVNGVSMTESYGSNKSATGTSKTAIGRWDSGTSYYFHGSIAGCKVFNTPLTAAQALELYNNPEQILPTGVAAANLKRYYPLCDYQNPSADSLNGLYVMDLGADKVNGLCYMTNTSASGGGMDRAEQPPCPQLGLMPSTSRRYTVDDSYVSIGADSDINGLFSSGGTLAFWAQAMSIGHEVVAYLVYTGTGGYTVYLQNDSSGTAKILFKTYHGTTSGEWITDNQVITYGTWQHIVFAYDASSVSNDPVIYINGSATAITEQQTPVGTTPADSAAKIIGNNDTPNRCWDGYISEVAMWKTVLDADAVAAIYNSGVQGFDLLSDSGNYDVSSSLKGWWKLNNLHTIQDLTAFNNDGSSTGSPVLSVLPEGTTAGKTLFGNTEEKRLDNAVINLDGYSYVQVANDADLNPTITDGYTISVWAKSTCLGNGISTSMMSKEVNSSASRMYLNIRDDVSDGIQFNFGDGTVGNTDVGTGTLSDNNWHHYAFVLRVNDDGDEWTTADQFTDGAAGASGVDISARTQTSPSTAALWIGGQDGGAKWSGAVAYPRIYKRALSANEIKLLYSSGLRVVGGL
tara:strand:- start:622 stop:2781 length:2160 start_codon:yes stop_codon:yes gene_type:complete